MSKQDLRDVRDRMMPMLEAVREQYELRVPAGYPHIVDDVERGTVGIEIDPSYSLYITSDGAHLFAELYKRQPRTDNRSSAGWQKYAGLPFQDKRPLASLPTDQELRNMIGEIKQAFNYQPGLLYITED